jgi:hypothetical protein
MWPPSTCAGGGGAAGAERRAGQPATIVRLWRFLLGLATVMVAVAPAMEQLANRSFAGHMVQHLLLTLVAAPLMGTARPVATRWRGSGAAPRPARVVAAPTAVLVLLAGTLHLATMLLWHLPPLYDAAVASAPLHRVEHAILLVRPCSRGRPSARRLGAETGRRWRRWPHSPSTRWRAPASGSYCSPRSYRSTTPTRRSARSGRRPAARRGADEGRLGRRARRRGRAHRCVVDRSHGARRARDGRRRSRSALSRTPPTARVDVLPLPGGPVAVPDLPNGRVTASHLALTSRGCDRRLKPRGRPHRPDDAEGAT